MHRIYRTGCPDRSKICCIFVLVQADLLFTTFTTNNVEQRIHSAVYLISCEISASPLSVLVSGRVMHWRENGSYSHSHKIMASRVWKIMFSSHYTCHVQRMGEFSFGKAYKIQCLILTCLNTSHHPSYIHYFPWTLLCVVDTSRTVLVCELCSCVG